MQLDSDGGPPGDEGIKGQRLNGPVRPVRLVIDDRQHLADKRAIRRLSQQCWRSRPTNIQLTSPFVSSRFIDSAGFTIAML